MAPAPSFDLTVRGSAATGPIGGLSGYWGQLGSDSMKSYCDNNPEYITISFVNSSPENEPSGWPGTNFAGHCPGDYFYYDTPTGPKKSDLWKNCYMIMEGIPYCQARGVKVLLSIGGVYSSSSNYAVSTEDNGRSFADFLYNAYGPLQSNWTGPRPFDGGGYLNRIDGFDFDIEASLNNAPYTAMINRFRQLDPTLVITGAPQCPLADNWFYMKGMIQNAKFDALFIQFYNNPDCDLIGSSTNPLSNMNYGAWESFLASTTYNQGTKLYVGLPADPSAAGSGYVDISVVKQLVLGLKGRASFGGIALWDFTRGAGNIDAKTGLNFNQMVQNVLSYGDTVAPTTSTTVASTTTSSRSTTTTSSSATTTTKPLSSTTTTSSSIASTTSSTSTSPSSTTTSSSTARTSTSTSSTSVTSTTSSSATSPTSTSSTSARTSTTSTSATSTSTTKATSSSSSSSTSTKPTSSSTTSSSSTSSKPTSTSTTSSKTTTSATTKVTTTTTTTKLTSTSTKPTSSSTTSTKPTTTKSTTSTSTTKSAVAVAGSSSKSTSTSKSSSSTKTTAKSTTTSAKTTAKTTTTTTAKVTAKTTAKSTSSTKHTTSSAKTTAKSTSTRKTTSTKAKRSIGSARYLIAENTFSVSAVPPGSTSSSQCSESLTGSYNAAEPVPTASATNDYQSPTAYVDYPAIASTALESGGPVPGVSETASSLSCTEAESSSTTSAAGSETTSCTSSARTGNYSPISNSRISSGSLSVAYKFKGNTVGTSSANEGTSTSKTPCSDSTTTPYGTLGETSITSSSGTSTTELAGLTTALVTGTIYKTSTVRATRIHVVTKSPASVVNYPAGPHTVTDVFAASTTVCPVSEASKNAAATVKKYETKVAGSASFLASSRVTTMYTTKVHTLTLCHASVANCGLHSATTEVSSWTTTVAPATQTALIDAEYESPDSTVTIKATAVVYATVTVNVATASSPSMPDDSLYQTSLESTNLIQPSSEPSATVNLDKPDSNAYDISAESTSASNLVSNLDADANQENAEVNGYQVSTGPTSTLVSLSRPYATGFQASRIPTNAQPLGVAAPTGGCTGEGCSATPYTYTPPAATATSQPVTAGASSIRVGLVVVAAMGVLQMFV